MPQHPGKKRRRDREKVTRLEDLIVEEVSVVDRPANQRRFLMVKDEDGMSGKGTPVVKDGEGNLVPDADASKDPPQDPPKPPPSLSEVFKKASEDMEKIEKRLSMTPEMRTDVFRGLGDAMDRLGAVFRTVDSAEMDKDGGESKLVPILQEELGEISKAIAEVSKRLGKTKKSDGDGDDGGEKPGDKLQELVESVEARVAKSGDGDGPTDQGVDRFREAVQELHKAMDGLIPADQQPADQGANNEKIAKAMGKLVAQVETLTKRTKEQSREIQALRRSTPGSNAIPVEKSDPPQDAEETVSWPWDMNDPKTRDRVDKRTSFLEG